MSQIVSVTTPLEALRYAAWSAFKKTAMDIDIERDSYIRRSGHALTRETVFLFAGQNATREFHLAMDFDMADPADSIFPPPPKPGYAKAIELAKHKQTFLQTWLCRDRQKLADLIGHYDEESPYSIGPDKGWECAELLSTRPAASEITLPPKPDKTTHNKILSYIWADIGREQYETDLTQLPAKVTLSWIRHEISRTIADEMQTLSVA